MFDGTVLEICEANIDEDAWHDHVGISQKFYIGFRRRGHQCKIGRQV